jgi:CelD/BcsL family acetyltransferase involved in cellulose biosynthesis
LTLCCERLADPQALAALAPEWDALDAQVSPRTPFTGPLWNLLWWKHFSADRLFVRDELFAYAVRKPSGELVAVAPMMISHRPAVSQLRARVLQFFGADANVTEIRGLTCRPRDQEEVTTALNAEFRARAKQWDWLCWSGLRTNGAAPGLEHAQTSRATPIRGYYLPLPASWEEFRSRRSRNIKESLRKCYNSLQREHVAFTFRAAERPQETRDAIGRFFALHAARARAAVAVEHRDVFEDERVRRFLGEYTQAAAERGQVRVFEMEVAGKVIASRVGFVLGDELYLYYSGYDVSWGRFSVMTTVVAESIKWAIARGLKVANLSTGQDVSKARWGPEEVVYRSAVQLSPTWRGRMAHRVYYDLLRRDNLPTRLDRLLALVRR